MGDRCEYTEHSLFPYCSLQLFALHVNSWKAAFAPPCILKCSLVFLYLGAVLELSKGKWRFITLETVIAAGFCLCGQAFVASRAPLRNTLPYPFKKAVSQASVLQAVVRGSGVQ